MELHVLGGTLDGIKSQFDENLNYCRMIRIQRNTEKILNTRLCVIVAVEDVSGDCTPSPSRNSHGGEDIFPSPPNEYARTRSL